MTQCLVIAGGRTFLREYDLPPGAFAQPMTLHIGGQALQRNVLAQAVKAEADPRDDAERRMMRKLMQLFDKLAPDVAKQLAAGVMPPEQELFEAFRRVIEVQLVEVATDELLAAQQVIGVQFDPTAANEKMAEWARRYTFREVSDMNITTVAGLRRTMERWATETGMNRGQLVEAITEDLQRSGAPFSRARAESIAITEVTRGASAAQNQNQKDLAAAGLDFERIWETRDDEIVCPICGPLDGKPESVWIGRFPDGPAAHPRCRCGTSLRQRRT